jgi:hypothetical protein
VRAAAAAAVGARLGVISPLLKLSVCKAGAPGVRHERHKRRRSGPRASCARLALS